MEVDQSGRGFAGTTKVGCHDFRTRPVVTSTSAGNIGPAVSASQRDFSDKVTASGSRDDRWQIPPEVPRHRLSTPCFLKHSLMSSTPKARHLPDSAADLLYRRFAAHRAWVCCPSSLGIRGGEPCWTVTQGASAVLADRSDTNKSTAQPSKSPSVEKVRIIHPTQPGRSMTRPSSFDSVRAMTFPV